jgi:hypothetical protein
LPGIALFFLGNKEEQGKIVPADGVRKEFEIAKTQNVATLPVGGTGSMAAELSAEMLADSANVSPALAESLKTLQTPVDDLHTLLEPTIHAIRVLADE